MLRRNPSGVRKGGFFGFSNPSQRGEDSKCVKHQKPGFLKIGWNILAKNDCTSIKLLVFVLVWMLTLENTALPTKSFYDGFVLSFSMFQAFFLSCFPG